MKKIVEKKHRLQRELYRGQMIATFTICVFNKQKIFTTQEVFNQMERFLLDSLKKFDCGSLVYLFMPEHCHITIEGCSEEADLWRCIVSFKQVSGYWLAKHSLFGRCGFQPAIKWQKDFYDHILKKDEDVKKHVLYILNNPVRKGIVENWKDYPYKGSTKFNFYEW